ncbi:hypothetical protein [Pantoea agglomerans]|uniref:hypothetical protein n=1 Tax=Enterobacter agglomerans TaxID=549 RepID=UPI00177F9571|nr:hypothetical protein [Pantoea agglomerans]MBD8154862.1 hypothetical protein [Pantoea agglomerans]MBD8242521.1 hypothetical protein [Pantoea agglomerans]WVL84690.1 hypothetical protein IFU02_019810 [Pantoea agglomerans]
MTNNCTAFEKSRKHIADAFIDYCKRRSGGHPVCAVKVRGKQVILGELTSQAVYRCLTDCFEVACFARYGTDNSQQLLTATYSGMLNHDGSKLTPEGIGFMEDVMSNAVEMALKDPRNNSLGLEMY